MKIPTTPEERKQIAEFWRKNKGKVRPAWMPTVYQESKAAARKRRSPKKAKRSSRACSEPAVSFQAGGSDTAVTTPSPAIPLNLSGTQHDAAGHCLSEDQHIQRSSRIASVKASTDDSGICASREQAHDCGLVHEYESGNGPGATPAESRPHRGSFPAPSLARA